MAFSSGGWLGPFVSLTIRTPGEGRSIPGTTKARVLPILGFLNNHGESPGVTTATLSGQPKSALTFLGPSTLAKPLERESPVFLYQPFLQKSAYRDPPPNSSSAGGHDGSGLHHD